MTELPVAEPAMPVLLFRVAGLTCAVPAGHVVETMRPLPVTAVDGMPPFVPGVSTIRGRTTPVLDLAMLLHRPSDRATRWITIHAGDRVVALAVDAVIGVSRFSRGDLQARPPLLASGEATLVKALAMKDEALYLVLDATRLVGESGAVQ